MDGRGRLLNMLLTCPFVGHDKDGIHLAFPGADAGELAYCGNSPSLRLSIAKRAIQRRRLSLLI